VGQGRLLPSTSVEQYAATLGRWFGISDTDLLMVLRNLGRWDVWVRRWNLCDVYKPRIACACSSLMPL
jgi:hypothetical protein